MARTGQQAKTSAQNDICAAKNWFRADPDEKPCKVCHACKKEKKGECTLYPYNSGCCAGQEGHHLIPVHCFMPPKERALARKQKRNPSLYKGCDNYDEDLAPCLCLGQKEHDEFHNEFDKRENAFKVDGRAGSWKYTDARDAAAEVSNELVGCDEKCIKAQLDEYHKRQAKMRNPSLRADSRGRSGSPDIPLAVGDDQDG